ncbi:MAG: NAD(P)/FAD-dependent oxidoreductase [Rhodobacterales bacterium]|nr:NAD(P)/FAD-dependent oxidoreductase [Rhodobacterales bacterium]
MPSSDVIVIGGGPNGLAAATRLAQSGRRVTLVEAQPQVGGGAATTEFHTGYRTSALAHILQGPDARVASAMKLDAHGLRLSTPLTTAVPGIDPLTMQGTFGKVSGLAATDLAAWSELQERLTRFARLLAPMRQMTPPRPAAKAGNDLWNLGKLGLSLRSMGKVEFRELLRMLLINVADVLEDDLTDDRLMGLLAFDATLGAWAGPRSPNSLIVYLNRIAAGETLTLPMGGMGSVAAAMRKAAEAAGVTVLTGSPVDRIDMAADIVIGVTLANGENFAAGAVLSAICPRRTLETLVGPRYLDTGFIRRARAIKSRGGAAKLHLALTGAPHFPAADLTWRIVLAPSVNAVENAFNPVKYGEVPDAPVMEITFPTAHDPSLAPSGHHVLSAVVQFAPHAPKDRDAARAQMLQNTLNVLETAAPGLRPLIAHAEILMPYDIEDRFGMSGGSWHHGDLAVEQMLFLRPFAGVSQYNTPIPGLWLGGAGSHPGGGISGAAGWNAATQLLQGAKP